MESAGPNPVIHVFKISKPPNINLEKSTAKPRRLDRRTMAEVGADAVATGGLSIILRRRVSAAIEAELLEVWNSCNQAMVCSSGRRSQLTSLENPNSATVLKTLISQ
ncbi:Hypothetical predicted protein [Olea europaea subsp. europaea]|uniref:Uncharacterized protein n=1 Tax=Olea europaea subsp. europaea TaxID=158383 RepID=A0A8S0QVT3_OLEEU|nr:Hypothetical predicted protein [Olea europaea subsp. europaea]